jgi:hypothetical protein
MGVWVHCQSKINAVKIPIAHIGRLRLVFPAEKLVHKSRGIDRTKHMPTRFYDTPTGRWAADDTNLLRLLHNEFPFVIERIAKVQQDTEFAAISTNYGSNPCYCIRRPQSEASTVPLFYLAQENFDEPKSALSVLCTTRGTQVDANQVKINVTDQSVTDLNGQKLPEEALVFTAPAIVWNGAFITWERYARETYDCRNLVRIQYPYAIKPEEPDKFEEVRAEIQRLQLLWEERERYVEEVLRTASLSGYAEYERMIVGVGGKAENRYLLLASVKGTAKSVADQLISDFSDIEAAFQMSEGGGTGIVAGTLSDWRILGASDYRRGRVLCCLLIEVKSAED